MQLTPSLRTPSAHCFRRTLSAAGLALVAGCGGGVPLLHPAQVLPPGKTAFAAGLSDRLALGAERRALNEAREGTSGAPRFDPRFTRGVLVALSEGPAVTPYAAGRIGIAGSNEAGLSASGPALRGDARHAWAWGAAAFSAGLGVTGRGFGQRADLAEADFGRARGYGLDLPLLVGYHTDADLISVWGGLRASLDHWSGSVSLDAGGPFQLSADRAALGPVLGIALGLPPFWVMAELEVDRARVAGSLDRAGTHFEAAVDGWSARPAGALVAKF